MSGLSNDEKFAELKRIEKKYGLLTALVVIDEARAKGSILHDEFTWDNVTAAERWRLEEARTLIRSVTIEYQVHDRKITTVAFVRDPAQIPSDQGYASVTSLQSDKARARNAITAEFDSASSRLKRARDLAVALGLEDEVEAHIKGIAGTRERVLQS